MEAFFHLLGILCGGVLIGGAVGFGLTCGIRAAMNFAPWNIKVQIQAAGEEDTAE